MYAHINLTSKRIHEQWNLNFALIGLKIATVAIIYIIY